MMRARTRRALGALAVLFAIPLTAAPAGATGPTAPTEVTADSPPYGTLECGYNVGHGGSGRWYRNCTAGELNIGAAPFQGLWCVPANSYRELSAWSLRVQIVSTDCSDPPTNK